MFFCGISSVVVHSFTGWSTWLNCNASLDTDVWSVWIVMPGVRSVWVRWYTGFAFSVTRRQWESVWPLNPLPHTEIISHLISIGHQKPPTGVTGQGVQAAGDWGKIRWENEREREREGRSHVSSVRLRQLLWSIRSTRTPQPSLA